MKIEGKNKGKNKSSGKRKGRGPLVGLLALLAGSVEPARAEPAEVSANAPALEWKSAPATAGVPKRARSAESRATARLGARLYAQRCASCHGARGQGDGPVAAALGVPARDFSTGIYKIRSTPSGSLPTNRDLFQTISRGVHGTAMFPWGRFSERERWALVSHLKSLSPRFRSERPEPVVVVPQKPAAPRSLVPRGGELYALLRCHACHGEDGGGDGSAVQMYRDTDGRMVRIRHLDKERFIRGSELEDIYLTLRTGFDGTPMGAYDLPARDLWALAVFVRWGLRQPLRPEALPRAEAPTLP